MSAAREAIASKLWLSVPSTDNDQARRIAERMLDAYRAEVLREAAATVRGMTPKHLDNETDVAIFWALDAAGNALDSETP